MRESNLSRLLKKIAWRLRKEVFKNSYKQVVLSKRAIRRLVNRKDAVIVEIGAADGLDSLEFLELFGDPQFKLICIEPESKNIVQFLQHIHDNRATFIQAAISDSDGIGVLNLSSTAYSSSLKTPNLEEIQKRWPEISFNKTQQVATRSLDSLVQELNLELIDFIWADVQGAEDLLIQGATEALKKTRFLYTEYGGESLYSNDLSLKQLQELLGDSWDLLFDYKTDALFMNIDLTSD